MNFFERYLTVWIVLCIGLGIMLGQFAPEVAQALDGMAIIVNDAPVVSVPIALCLFFMMCPIMVKIDFHEVVNAGKSVKPVRLTMFINWAVKPFTMYAIASFFLGTLFLKFIVPDAIDLVRMPLGLVTLVLLFSFKGETIVQNPLTILWIAIPLFVQTVLVFALGYGLSNTFWVDLRKRGTDGNDRCIKSLRGDYSDGGHALRSVVGSCACNRGGRSDRGPPDADAGAVLPGDAGLVSA